MLDTISRWLRLRHQPDPCVQRESEARQVLEQKVEAQLVELISYMDRLGVKYQNTALNELKLERKE